VRGDSPLISSKCLGVSITAFDDGEILFFFGMAELGCVRTNYDTMPYSSTYALLVIIVKHFTASRSPPTSGGEIKVGYMM